MPRIIRQALAERLLKTSKVEAYLRDFSMATGVPVRFATPLGVEVAIEGSAPAPAVCVWMREDRDRGRLCGQTIQEGVLLPGEKKMPGRSCGAVCVAGLREVSIPLRIGGEIFGYLLIGQVATQGWDQRSLNRWRHALERVGQKVVAADLEALVGSATILTEEDFASAIRVLEWSVSGLAGQLEEHLLPPVDQLAPPVRKACNYIRNHYPEPISLTLLAEQAGMSREHFCTLFHKNTGVRFVDYLTRIRVERAGELLRTTRQPVTEIALACGFQSISHFNRRFVAITGETPSSFRRGKRDG